MRVLIVLSIFINFIFADTYFEAKILKSNPSFNFENIKEQKGFEKIEFPYIKQGDLDNYWIKLQLNKNKFENQEKVLNIYSMFAINTIQMDPRLDTNIIDQNTILINKDIDVIYFKVLNIQKVINVTVDIRDKNAYFQDELLENKLYGISLGITITAFLYYLLFFLFNRKKSFLYYSLTQAFGAAILTLSQQTSYLPYDFISLGFIVFSILFTQEFLQTKKNSPLLHRLFNISIVIFIIDSFMNLVEYFPVSFLMLLYPISGVVIYFKTRQKQILFYILAWSIIVFTFVVITIEVYLVSFISYSLNLEDIVHIIIPLESIILAFALSYMMKANEDEKIEKEKLLIHQNKLASIGEMINNIAHQWRQPLTHLGYIFMNINKAHSLNRLDEKYLKGKTKEATEQLSHMSSTIDIFKDFYMPKNTKSTIRVKEELKNALKILSASLTKENIDIKIEGEDFAIDGYSGELSQVFLNIISNSRDALVDNSIDNPYIKISFEENKIYIQDNAGGINKEHKDNIFSAYFTTKKEGSGIGLYMSKTIVENHFNGNLYHENKDHGSLFIIKF